MEREIIRDLIQWKNKSQKKALLITGARQIGKTYIIRQFGKQNYQEFVEINFIENESAANIFKNVRTAEEIIINITALAAKKLEPGKTLIFLMKYRNVRRRERQSSFWLMMAALITLSRVLCWG